MYLDTKLCLVSLISSQNRVCQYKGIAFVNHFVTSSHSAILSHSHRKIKMYKSHGSNVFMIHQLIILYNVKFHFVVPYQTTFFNRGAVSNSSGTHFTNRSCWYQFSLLFHYCFYLFNPNLTHKIV